MAKKYLLYIHNDRFEKETNKSGLVNALLDAYWSGDKVTEFKSVTAIAPSGSNATVTYTALNGQERCAGHATRWDCGRAGCKYV